MGVTATEEQLQAITQTIIQWRSEKVKESSDFLSILKDNAAPFGVLSLDAARRIAQAAAKIENFYCDHEEE